MPPDGHAMASLEQSADALPQDVNRPLSAACQWCAKTRMDASMAATVVVAQTLVSAACAASLTLTTGPNDNANRGEQGKAHPISPCATNQCAPQLRPTMKGKT